MEFNEFSCQKDDSPKACGEVKENLTQASRLDAMSLLRACKSPV